MGNYRLVAIQVGNTLINKTSINEINRIGSAILRFQCGNFPNDAITSSRAKLIYNWILSLAKKHMKEEERDRLLYAFCKGLCSDEESQEAIRKILESAEISLMEDSKQIREFSSRNFHSQVIEHCSKLFFEENYFHAVFEACKVYNKLAKEKSQSSKDGTTLMMEIWGWQKGVLKVTKCETETDKNVQEGIKYLSAGLMQAIRNPTAHEPALDWPINKEDCLDMLSFLSFLFRQL